MREISPEELEEGKEELISGSSFFKEFIVKSKTWFLKICQFSIICITGRKFFYKIFKVLLNRLYHSYLLSICYDYSYILNIILIISRSRILYKKYTLRSREAMI